MRLKITLEMNGVELPVNYNDYIQAFIYSSLPHQLSSLHNSPPGVITPFTFSNLFNGVYNETRGTFTFSDTAHFFISSPHNAILEGIYNTLTCNGKINIFNNYIDVIEIDPIENNCKDGPQRYKTISPVTVYKESLPYSPIDKIYGELIRSNIEHKYYQLYGVDMNEYFNLYMIEDITKCVRKHRIKKKDQTNKNAERNYAHYECYDFTMKIDATKKIHELIMDWGLGARNALGNGMLEPLQK